VIYWQIGLLISLQQLSRSRRMCGGLRTEIPKVAIPSIEALRRIVASAMPDD
jgi:hypothetical protein